MTENFTEELTEYIADDFSGRALCHDCDSEVFYFLNKLRICRSAYQTLGVGNFDFIPAWDDLLLGFYKHLKQCRSEDEYFTNKFELLYIVYEGGHCRMGRDQTQGVDVTCTVDKLKFEFKYIQDFDFLWWAEQRNICNSLINDYWDALNSALERQKDE